MSIESERSQRQRKASESQPFPRVIPWLDWVKLRGISLSTAERLQRAGKIKVTYLAPRRKGVREDHDREYLAACAPPADDTEGQVRGRHAGGGKA